MEMPCICDCGEAFDLNDGFGTMKYNRNITICPECHQKEKNLEREIEKLENEAEYLDFMNKKPKRVEKLLQQAKELKEKLYY